MKWFAFLVVLLGACSAGAQVLSTADTLGKGKSAILLSDNEIYAAGIVLNVAYGMFTKE